MTRRQVMIGLFVILVIVIGVILFNRFRKTPKVPLTSAAPVSQNEQSIESKFNLTIPDNVQKADLNKVGETEGMGFATRSLENGNFILTVLADLPDLPAGGAYQVWLQKDADNKLFVGNLQLAKGGWLLNYGSTTDLSSYNTVSINLANSPVLSGSF